MPFIPSRLIVVTEIFELQDGTLHFSPLVPSEVIDREHLKVGDPLELRRPDGTVVKTTLHNLDWPVPSRGKLGLCLNKSLTKTDIPVGTEIWKVTKRLETAE
jgi:hypothetical protein